tara:strand:+ start:114 stop:305 length:192 start_codon:yes stop_codon:yes gene_type:complete
MLKKLERYVKNEQQGFLKVAAYCGYDDVGAIKNWIRRRSIPKHMETRLKPLLEGEVKVGISIK